MTLFHSLVLGKTGAVRGGYVGFPLTPALSPREMETPDAVFEETKSAGLVENRATILPLPKGEGRGEGEGSSRKSITPYFQTHLTSVWRPLVIGGRNHQ